MAATVSRSKKSRLRVKKIPRAAERHPFQLSDIELALVAEGLAHLTGGGYGVIGPAADNEWRVVRRIFRRIVAFNDRHRVMPPEILDALDETLRQHDELYIVPDPDDPLPPAPRMLAEMSRASSMGAARLDGRNPAVPR